MCTVSVPRPTWTVSGIPARAQAASIECCALGSFSAASAQRAAEADALARAARAGLREGLRRLLAPSRSCRRGSSRSTTSLVAPCSAIS